MSNEQEKQQQRQILEELQNQRENEIKENSLRPASESEDRPDEKEEYRRR